MLVFNFSLVQIVKAGMEGLFETDIGEPIPINKPWLSPDKCHNSSERGTGPEILNFMVLEKRYFFTVFNVMGHSEYFCPLAGECPNPIIPKKFKSFSSFWSFRFPSIDNINLFIHILRTFIS